MIGLKADALAPVSAAARAAGYRPDQVDGVLRVYGRQPGVDDRVALVMGDGRQFFEAEI